MVQNQNQASSFGPRSSHHWRGAPNTGMPPGSLYASKLMNDIYQYRMAGSLSPAEVSAR
jgi:hypothetical protein